MPSKLLCLLPIQYLFRFEIKLNRIRPPSGFAVIGEKVLGKVWYHGLPHLSESNRALW